MASFVAVPPSNASVIQDDLENACRLVEQNLQADKAYGDLSDLLGLASHKQPTLSGLHEVDYPILSDPKVGLDSLSEISSVKRVPLPPELVEQFAHMQYHCMMGLFPEISRAWLSIDSDIFVWNYEDGSDLAYFDGLSDTILCAGLIIPKPGIFQPHIQYLLCLATPVDIVLLGVSFVQPFDGTLHEDNRCFGEMHLLPDPLFSIPTDGTHMISVNGSENGRIFMAGKDGCLYELIYQAEDGWFSRKCRKVNHSTSTLSFLMPSFLNFSLAEDDPLQQISIDESRHILYTRSQKATIQVYDLGENGCSMSRIAAVSQQTTQQNASLIARTIDRTNFKEIIHISAIPKSESVNVHLVAITYKGVRLYFTTDYFGQNRRPSMLSLVHVRLPPGFSASGSPQKPCNVHKAYYSKGTLVLSSSRKEVDSDVLWTLGADTFPFQQQLMETQTMTPVDGRTWVLSEIPVRLPRFEADDSFKTPGKCDPPIVVSQHIQPIRRFVLLSSKGSHLMDKYLPVNQLQQLLIRNQGADNEEVKAFFQLHKEEQACATCLILCCSRSPSNQHIVEWATRAFFLYGGESTYNYLSSAPSQTGNIGPGFPQSPAVASRTSGFQPSSPMSQTIPFATPAHGSQPIQMSTPNTVFAQKSQFGSSTGPNFTLDIKFSGKHNGICLYLSRILRPIWEMRIVSDKPLNCGGKEFLSSRFSSEELSWFLKHLEGLKDFIESNTHFSAQGLADGTTSFQQSRLVGQMDDQYRKQQAEAQTHEKTSLQQILVLINRTYEALGLWKIICDHQFHTVIAMLDERNTNTIKSMTFRQFCLVGKELCQELVSSIIRNYLNDNASVDAISGRLREVCPTLYSTEDAICSKANEMLQTVKTIQNPNEREAILREALALYKNIAISVNLPSVCNYFAFVHFYEGIVDLSLCVANKCDPQQLALHYYSCGGALTVDYPGMEAFFKRNQAYKCITDTLGGLLSTSMLHPQSPSVPRTPGPPPAVDTDRLTSNEAEQYSESMFQLALRSDDQLFHVALYEWLLEQKLYEKLLEIQSPFLEAFLKKAPTEHNAQETEMLDLLWKYYEKTKNYQAAAKIQAKLADRQQTDVTLQQRIEYLSRAIMCAKSSTIRGVSGADGEFLHELEEKMDVARLQIQMLETLQRLPATVPQLEEAISRLNSELLDITTLYGDFAERFDIAESKLAIIHCASHYDPSLVESLWQDIIEKELNTTANIPSQTAMTILSNKIVSLGRSYSATERYFPVAFLIQYLEKRSCQLGFDSKWVFTILIDCGVKITTLLEIYDRLIKSKDPFWVTSKKPLHLLSAVHQLILAFTDTPALVPVYERRQFTTVCLDALAGYLVELQSTSSIDIPVNQLIRDFKGLQAKLDRLI
ncbi:nuclear pore complex protein Nup155-like [Tubulanus polymorphus]|uniref:nuclear pore complex protein Nup155-like n=1 Tax=Tubulanus polymorphus TaxID=672921 RepID=UPI003DA69FB7